MWRRIAFAVGVLVVALTTLWIGFTLAMRTKYRPVQDAIRRVNREVFNPRAMRTAGQPGAYTSVVRHVGRTSGTPYATPVGVEATEEGFVVALPYGTAPDWLRNVQAAGSATIVHEGSTHHVDRPEIVPSDVAMPYVPPRDRWTLRLYGVDRFLKIRRVVVPETQPPTAVPE